MQQLSSFAGFMNGLVQGGAGRGNNTHLYPDSTPAVDSGPAAHQSRRSPLLVATGTVARFTKIPINERHQLCVRAAATRQELSAGRLSEGGGHSNAVSLHLLCSVCLGRSARCFNNGRKEALGHAEPESAGTPEGGMPSSTF